MREQLQELIEKWKARQVIGDIDSGQTSFAFGYCAKELEAIIAENKPNWIPSDDPRKPETSETIVWVQDMNNEVYLATYHNKKDWITLVGDVVTDFVLQWMPIEPPEAT